MAHQVTMEAIAELSGVSISTVSLVLRDKPGINAETRKRVIETARRLGYQRKYLTEIQRPQELAQIGLVMKCLEEHSAQVNQFYSHVIASIEAACRKIHVNLLYATIPVDADNHPLALPRLFSDTQIDGVLLVGAFADSTVTQAVTEKAIPMVLVDAYAPLPAYDAIVSDNLDGAYEAVTYLIAHQHRHIGLIGTIPNAYPSINDRRAGYFKALVDHGISETYVGDSMLQSDACFAATLRLLQHHPEITAIFAANDESAISAMRAARMLGRDIPGDLSIIGFDDVDLAQHVTPTLTTMQIDKITMGRLAVQMLVNRVDYPTASRITTVIRPRLIERQSVTANPIA